MTISTSLSTQDESLTLASILRDPDLMPDAMRALTPEMFHTDWHRDVFAAMCRIEAANKSPDINAVAGELRAIKAGGRGDDALDVLTIFMEKYEFASSQTRITPVINRVRESWQRRQVTIKAVEIQARANDLSESPSEIVADVDALATILDDSRITVSDPLIATQRVSDALNHALEHGEQLGFKSGHWLFDRNSLGFVEGSIGVEAADTGGGKTHNLWHRCRNFKIANNQNAGFISGEMTEDELIQRQIVGDANLAKAAARKLDQREIQEIQERLSDYARNPLDVISPPSMNLDDVLSAVRLLARRKQCKLIVIDYAQMIYVKGERDPNEAARRVYGDLKAIAMRLRIAIVLASQFNKVGRREAAKHSPLKITEADIYGSSHASYYSHTIIHTLRIGHHLHDSEVQRIAAKLQEHNIDPQTVTLERVLKSRRGQKQRYTMASQFKRWRMQPLDAKAHQAIRDVLNTAGDQGDTDEQDPLAYFRGDTRPTGTASQSSTPAL